MWKLALFALFGAALIAAQTVPDLSGDECDSECAGLASLDGCNTTETETLQCVCNVYQTALTSSCISCWNGIDPDVGQELQELVEYCQNGQITDFGTSFSVPATETGFTAESTPSASGTITGQGGATSTGAAAGTTAASQASSTPTGSSTSSPSAKSGGDRKVVEMGILGLVIGIVGVMAVL